MEWCCFGQLLSQTLPFKSDNARVVFKISKYKVPEYI